VAMPLALVCGTLTQCYFYSGLLLDMGVCVDRKYKLKDFVPCPFVKPLILLLITLYDLSYCRSECNNSVCISYM
jgi:hypothetical protein